MAKKILIIDDDIELAGNIAQALKLNGYDVVTAHNSADGLKTLLKERPDLILLDVMMETDTAGFEVTNIIRSKRESSKYREVRDTPIIMLTAINQATNSRFSLSHEQSFLPRLNDFLTKPINLDRLLEKVKEHA